MSEAQHLDLVVQFYEKNLVVGKAHTVKHFVTMDMTRSTVYSILMHFWIDLAINLFLLRFLFLKIKVQLSPFVCSLLESKVIQNVQDYTKVAVKVCKRTRIQILFFYEILLLPVLMAKASERRSQNKRNIKHNAKMK